LDGDHYKSTTFAAFGTTIVVATTTNTRRSIRYITANRKNGETTYF
jgi:hypothetical protein